MPAAATAWTQTFDEGLFNRKAGRLQHFFSWQCERGGNLTFTPERRPLAGLGVKTLARQVFDTVAFHVQAIGNYRSKII
jgi:hypothetical protein